MVNTPGGLPYPLGTDFVADGDNAIHALAVAVDTRPYSLSALAGQLPIPQAVYTTIGIGVAPAFTTEARGIVYSSVDGTFTVPVAGLYVVSWGFLMTGGAGTLRATRILQGATTLAYASGTPSGGNPTLTDGTRTFRLAAGAKLTFAVYHDAPGTLPAQPADTFLNIAWVGV